MPDKINILPDHVVNKIAAGEVVDRPASAVKELVENSIDAGASEIFIDIEQAGRRLIRITDNGSGMSKKDAQTAFLRHATSKITTDADLEAIRTMGFRGEALSSIAAVSQVRLVTAVKDMSAGVLIEIKSDAIKVISDTAAPLGTSIEISNLFYNTPARLKFLKSAATEFSHIVSAVSRQAMAHPDISFRLTHNKKPVIDLPSSMSLKERTFQLYGNEIADNLMEFEGNRDGIRIHGLIGRPSYTRADRTYQDFYVNRRAIKNPSLTHALYSAYHDMLMRDRHPVGFIFIDIDPALVDVNVHPAKTEVRFRNQSQIHDLVRDVIREGLRTQGISAADATVTAYGSHAVGVREALADYLRNQTIKEDGSNVVKSPPFFGRRKNDVGTAPLSYDHDSSVQRESHAEPQTRPSGSPEHYMYPLAQVHDSFIIAQSEEGMAIIDQHAAHERVLFEKLQDQFDNKNIPVQTLLMPDQVELGPAQSSLLSEYLPELNQLGFAVEEFGGGTFMIKAVPSLLVGADYRKLVLDVLDEVTVFGESRKMDELRDKVLSVMACHPAIKIHRHLEQKEMEILISELFRCRMPHTCPHGRPTIIRLPLSDIRKMFKRV
ncbi:MAG TPA: DNA mismatch repair endonuclease MutL [Nitrospirota bacterium]|nr:DNA mismatch repair endonuclease MutL [Nitrospirota bacterium]